MQHFKYIPNGAIQYKAELETLIEDAKSELIIIPIYAVVMGGTIEEYFITQASDFSTEDAEKMVQYIFETYQRQDKPEHWHSIRLLTKLPSGRMEFDYRLVGNWNIEGDCRNDHYLFTSKMLAEKWSLTLKTDPAYQLALIEHNAMCDMLDEAMEDWYDSSDDFFDGNPD